LNPKLVEASQKKFTAAAIELRKVVQTEVPERVGESPTLRLNTGKMGVTRELRLHLGGRDARPTDGPGAYLHVVFILSQGSRRRLATKRRHPSAMAVAAQKEPH
jgi:hypothetical protein